MVRIASVGRLVPEKGQRLLIEAVASLVRAGADMRLSLAGDGPERASLEQLAAELGVTGQVEFSASSLTPTSTSSCGEATSSVCPASPKECRSC